MSTPIASLQGIGFMIVTWYGHACIALIVDGYTIVVDPHDGASIGIKKPDVKADLVLVTHDHFDHNAVKVVAKDRARVFKMFYGESIVDNVKIIGLKTYHDKFKGRKRGENAVYVIEVGGYRVAHLGDLGEVPGEDVLARIKGVHLLAIPVGGTFTVEPNEAWQIVEKTTPLNVLPMHYWIPGLTLPLKPVEEFLEYVKGYDVVKLNKNSFDLASYANKVIVLAPP